MNDGDNSKKDLILYVLSGMIFIEVSLIIFILRILKDATPNPKIVNDFFFNLGFIGCLLTLPILAFLAFLAARITKKTEAIPEVKAVINRIGLVAYFTSFVGLFSSILTIYPIKIALYNYSFSISYILGIGILFGYIFFKRFSSVIKKNR